MDFAAKIIVALVGTICTPLVVVVVVNLASEGICWDWAAGVLIDGQQLHSVAVPPDRT